MYCTYCGMAQGDRISCCSENHWMTAQEFRDYYGDWPSDFWDATPVPRNHPDFEAWLEKQTPTEAP